jgi:hypothetical protein
MNAFGPHQVIALFPILTNPNITSLVFNKEVTTNPGFTAPVKKFGPLMELRPKIFSGCLNA